MCNKQTLSAQKRRPRILQLIPLAPLADDLGLERSAPPIHRVRTTGMVVALIDGVPKIPFDNQVGMAFYTAIHRRYLLFNRPSFYLLQQVGNIFFGVGDKFCIS